MPINYSVFAMKNPQKREEAPKYYGKVQARGTADFDVLADEIAYATTLTDGDVANVLRASSCRVRVRLPKRNIPLLSSRR